VSSILAQASIYSGSRTVSPSLEFGHLNERMMSSPQPSPESQESNATSTKTHVSQTQLARHPDADRSPDGDGQDQPALNNDEAIGHVLETDPFVLDPTSTQNGFLSEESADIEFQKGKPPSSLSRHANPRLTTEPYLELTGTSTNTRIDLH